MADVNITDNSDEVRAKLEEALESAGMQIGMLAEGYAKVLTPVDTGRLRNSISFASKGSSGKTHNYSDDKGNNYSDNVGEVTEHAVFIGTNTEYALYIEEGHHRYGGKHMLKRAASEHGDEYKAIIEESMKNA